jgi:mono/diheme cytochrome c family protein
VKPRHYVLGTAALVLVLLGTGALAFLYSGVYDIAASTPHMRPFVWAVTTLQRRAVEESAEGIRPPPLRDPALVRRGFVLYQQQCLICHGAPGVERPVIGRGMNPNPPRLALAAPDWSDAELYWIIKNGIKMGGMPAYWSVNDEDDLWSLVAYVRRLPEIDEEQHRAMQQVAIGRLPPSAVQWLPEDDAGWRELLRRGDPETGAVLLDQFGCGSCHVVPGIRASQGRSGPPLTRWAERHFIAGELLNNPRELVRWLVDPQAVEPGTAMPDLGVTPDQALHMAAYLYTLGTPPRALVNLQRRAQDR